MNSNRCDVVLIQMPYASIEHPSLALGLLKAGLQRHGIATKIVHANLVFAGEIGFRNYHFLSLLSHLDKLADWTFSRAAFLEAGLSAEALPDPDDRDLAYIQRVARAYFEADPAAIQSMVIGVSEAASFSVNRLADLVLAYHPAIVGCTSVFQQHCASLAILRKLKERQPGIITMMGGANCEDELGAVTHENFKWVDYVVSGEADELLPPLCSYLLEQGKCAQLDGRCQATGTDVLRMQGVMSPLFRRQPQLYASCGRSLVTDLDSLPYPDYTDYFAALANLEKRDRIAPGLFFETSRGCWWGEKNPCRFCGFNGCGMRYRKKSPDRVLAELQYLLDAYGINKLAAADNVLAREYYDTLLPELAKKKSPASWNQVGPAYSIQFATKSDLTRSQVESLRAAGILFIQPGIENLHNSLLCLLNKGVTSWQNIELLKWCLEQGVFVVWNFLYAIPGQTDASYIEMAEMLPLLFHLQAPTGDMRPIGFDRFSAYAKNPEAFGLILSPHWTYSFIYPLAAKELTRIAYFFQDVNAATRLGDANRWPGQTRCLALVREWNRLFYRTRRGVLFADPREDKPILDYVLEDGCLNIEDTRPCAVQREHTLTGCERDLYLLCETSQSFDSLAKGLTELREEDGGGENGVKAGNIEVLLAGLAERKLMLSYEGRYLSLAVPRTGHALPRLRDFPGGSYRISSSAAPYSV